MLNIFHFPFLIHFFTFSSYNEVDKGYGISIHWIKRDPLFAGFQLGLIYGFIYRTSDGGKKVRYSTFFPGSARRIDFIPPPKATTSVEQISPWKGWLGWLPFMSMEEEGWCAQSKDCLLLVMWYGRHGRGQYQQTML